MSRNTLLKNKLDMPVCCFVINKILKKEVVRGVRGGGGAREVGCEFFFFSGLPIYTPWRVKHGRIHILAAYKALPVELEMRIRCNKFVLVFYFPLAKCFLKVTV